MAVSTPRVHARSTGVPLCIENLHMKCAMLELCFTTMKLSVTGNPTVFAGEVASTRRI